MPDPTPTSETPPRPRWKRRLLIFVAVLVVLLVLAPLALSLGPLASIIEDNATESLGRTVTVDSAFAFWFHGVDVDGVVVTSPDGFDEPLARVDHVHVDVDLFGLLGGTVDADVLIERPHVLIERRGERSNLDGLFGKDEKKKGKKRRDKKDREAKDDEESTTSISLVVKDGILEARGIDGADQNRIESIQADVRMSPGSLSADVRALAKAAGVDGGDVQLEAQAEQHDQGEGPFRLRVPPLALNRISALVEGASGVRLDGGSLEIDAEGKLIGRDAAEGTLAIDANGVRASLEDGTTVSVGVIDGDVTLSRGDADGATGRVALRLEPVDVRESAAAGGRHFREPRIAIDANGRYADATGSLRIAAGTVDAGDALKIALTTPWEIELGEPRKASGDARLDADLSRLGSLRALFPDLTRLRRGKLAANLRGIDGQRLGVAMSANLSNLELAPIDADGLPYSERQVVVQARWLETDANTSRLDVYTLRSALLATTHTSTKDPFVVFMTEDGYRMDGRVGFRCDLGAVSRLHPKALGLKAGEQVLGVIDVDGNASGNEDQAEITATVQARGIRFPPRLAGRVRESNLTATLRAEMSGPKSNLVIDSLQGMGLSGTATARLDENAMHGVQDVNADLTVSLVEAAPLVFAFLEKDPPARLTGTLRSQITARGKDGGLAVSGTTSGTNVVWQATRDDPVLNEPRVSVAHDVWLAPEGERHRADKLVVSLGGLSATLDGSSVAMGADDPDVALKATLAGDAARLAPTLRAFLGPDYADLEGEAQISGTLTANGSPANGGRDLLVDGAVNLGCWATGGADFDDVQITVRRAAYEHPFAASLASKLNGGEANVGMQVDMSREPTPWSLSVRLKQVDTAELLVSQGLGEYLTYAVPSIIPADSQTPVLSGRLDGTADLRADGFDDPILSDTLRGTATMAMREGAIKESSLFRAGGKDTLGDATKVLVRLVPDVGNSLARLSEAIAFSSLDSRLRIENRIVNVEEMALVGPYVVIGMQGTAGFDERLDLDTRVQFKGKAGDRLAKYLPQGVVPLKVKGKLGKPKPRADIDVAKLAGGSLIDDLLGGGKKKKNPLKRLKDLIK